METLLFIYLFHVEDVKLLSRCGFLQARSSQRNEKCADRPTVCVRRCPVTGG